MKINAKKLKELGACKEAYDMYLMYGSKDLLKTLLKADDIRPDWASWLYTNLMTAKQNKKIVAYADAVKKEMQRLIIKEAVRILDNE